MPVNDLGTETESVSSTFGDSGTTIPLDVATDQVELTVEDAGVLTEVPVEPPDAPEEAPEVDHPVAHPVVQDEEDAGAASAKTENLSVANSQIPDATMQSARKTKLVCLSDERNILSVFPL